MFISDRIKKNLVNSRNGNIIYTIHGNTKSRYFGGFRPTEQRLPFKITSLSYRMCCHCAGKVRVLF